MAIAFVANRGNLSAATAAAPINIVPVNPNLITPGNTVFLLVYAQNNTSGVPSIFAGAAIGDPQGNAWVVQSAITTFNSAGAPGGLLQVYKSLNIFAYAPGDVLQIQGSLAGFTAGFQLFEFSGVSQASGPLNLATNAGVNATGSTPVAVGVQASGQLVLVAGGVGSTNVVTGDADTTDGSWSGAFRKNITTNFQMWEEQKILTGFTSATQSYQATWTSSGGDNTWGQIALVYDPNGSAAFTQQFPPQDNPNYGCPDSGFEPLPTGSALVPIDTGTAYQIEHTLPTYSFGTHGYSSVAQYDSSSASIQQHHVAYDLYQTGAEVPMDQIVSLTFPVGRVNLGADAYVLNSSGTQIQAGPQTNSALAAAALQTPGGSYIRFDALPTSSASPYEPFADIQFDFFGATGLSTSILSDYLNSRIVRLGVRFNGWKDDSSISGIAGEGLQFVYAPQLSTGVATTYYVELGAWLVPDYQRSASQQQRWLGEINPLPRIPASSSYYGSVGTQWFRTPPDAGISWTYLDMLTLGGTSTTSSADFFRIYGLPGADFSQTQVYLDFVELVVEVVPERRISNVISNISTAPQYANSPLGAAQYIPGRAAIGLLRNVVNETTPSVITGVPNDYTLVAREALPASSSDYYPALATAPAAPKVGGITLSSLGANVPFNLPAVGGLQLFTPQEAVGPSLNFLGYTQPRTMTPNQRPLTQRAVVDGVFATPAETITDFVLSFGALDAANYNTNGTLFPVFQGLAPLTNLKIYTAHSGTQKFYDGTGSYNQLRVVCKPDPLTTASLNFSLSPDATTITSITPAQALAGEPLGGGWYAVTTPCTAFTGSGTVQTLTISSTTSFNAPWQVSALQSIGNAAVTNFEPRVNNTTYITYATELECALTAISASLGSTTVAFTPPIHASCLTGTTVTLPTITLTNGASYDYVVVQRSVGNVGPWTLVSKVTAPANGQRVVDYEVPWDVSQFSASTQVYYLLTAYRNSDRRFVQAITTGYAGSASPGSCIGFGSNILGTMMVYVPVSTGDLEIAWSALNQVQMIPQHMRDYQYALRVPENRGLSATFPVEVNQFTQCTFNSGSSFFPAYQTEMLNYYNEEIGQGRFAFTPRPFEVSVLPVFDSPYPWMLLLPGGHQRKVSVTLGDMSITTVNGLYMTDLTVTDTIPPSSDPYSGS